MGRRRTVGGSGCRLRDAALEIGHARAKGAHRGMLDTERALALWQCALEQGERLGEVAAARARLG